MTATLAGMVFRSVPYVRMADIFIYLKQFLFQIKNVNNGSEVAKKLRGNLLNKLSKYVTNSTMT
jgi:hypothetical protein